jgi:hypothetical protein
MLDENAFRVQQAQRENKPKKTKSLIWKLFKGFVTISCFIYKLLKLFDGGDSN